MRHFPVVKGVNCCALCHSDRPLRESHIIPHFVFEWLLETSATGHMRLGTVPNHRVQDGFKQHLLCGKCETKIGVWETETARSVFRPYHDDTSAVIDYGPWFAKFCASICWRVLFIFRWLRVNKYSDSQLALADKALASWSDFMFDRAPSPGEFELHILPVDLIEDARGSELPTNINRYLARAVDMDAASKTDSAFVYAKLCKLIIIGFVQMPNAMEWKGTQVGVERGSIKLGTRVVPEVIGKYLTDRTRRAAMLQASISPRQKEKIASSMRSDVDRAVSAESYEALLQDVAMFGDKAFAEPKE